MKKLWIPMVLLLLLLAACMSVPEGETAPSSSTPSSSSITPPSSSVVPSSSTAPTTPLDVIKDGMAYIYRRSDQIVLPPDWTPPRGIKNCLYWVVKATKESILICDEPVIDYVTTDTHVYFVKESEPTNVYVTPIGDFSNHQLLPETPLPVIKEGFAFIYKGPQFVVIRPNWRPEEALLNHFYWVVESTRECILICDEPVANHTSTDTHVYFVKESEPTKIYRTPIGDFANHQLYYESSYGKVSYMSVMSNLTEFLQFVADEKKFVVCDMVTGESTLLMEQYYINYAVLFRTDDGTWGDIIEFEGKHAENDSPYTIYIYNRITGELQKDTTL